MSLETLTGTDDAPVALVTVTGEIDMASVQLLRDGVDGALQRNDVAAVLVDLSGTTFLSSAGNAVLVATHMRAQRDGIALRVVIRPESWLHRPLRITGVVKLLSIYPTREAALAA